MNRCLKRLFFVACVGLFVARGLPACAAELQSFVRLKGQATNTLTGLGLVVGLDGTGDSRFTPMHSAVARALGLLGNPVATLDQVVAIRNVALVTVTATVPETGSREGDQLDCMVSSIGTARSLAGGRLLQTPLRGPLVNEQTVFALAEGSVSIEGLANFNTGRVVKGARLTVDLLNPFILCEDTLTVVINDSHASFVTANQVAAAINARFAPQVSRGGGNVTIARAVDAKNVEVEIPEFARENVVAFVADLMQTDIREPNTQARVVINERTGVIVVTGEVELTPVLVTHRNLVILPPDAALLAGNINNFSALVNAQPGLGILQVPGATAAPGSPPDAPPPAMSVRLNDLLIAFDRAQVSAADKIAIIKELFRSGKLQAQLIFE